MVLVAMLVDEVVSDETELGPGMPLARLPYVELGYERWLTELSRGPLWFSTAATA
jgi:hypothetical protein